MTRFAFIAAAGAALLASACQGVPREMSVAEYCADAGNTDREICKVWVDVDGQKQALAQTNLSLSDARVRADEALREATAARMEAKAAAEREDKIYCETRTLQRTDTGSCSPGYTLVSCTQSRFTYRAGGPSIMRAIDDQQCRFHARVLEMKVRCCMAGAAPLPTETPAAPAAPTTASLPS